MSANAHATYVYPSALKAVVRARFPDTVKERLGGSSQKRGTSHGGVGIIHVHFLGLSR